MLILQSLKQWSECIHRDLCLAWSFSFSWLTFLLNLTGAPMEINISYRCRQDILTTSNLAHPDLFNNALNELLQLMKMVRCPICSYLCVFGNETKNKSAPFPLLVHILSMVLSFSWNLLLKNLVKDYWSSTFFLKFKEEASMRSDTHEMETMTGWNFSPRLSGVRSTDDPFHQEYLTKDSDHSSGHTDPIWAKGKENTGDCQWASLFTRNLAIRVQCSLWHGFHLYSMETINNARAMAYKGKGSTRYSNSYTRLYNTTERVDHLTNDFGRVSELNILANLTWIVY